MDDRPSDLRSAVPPPGRRAVLPLRRTPSRGRVWAGLAIFLVLAVIGWIVWRSHESATRAGRQTAPMSVVTTAAVTGDMPVTLAALGTVTPLATVTVTTQISGQLMEVGFREGQEVNKGDFLAQIDPRPYQAALDQLQGQLLKDQALLKDAQLNLARFQKLAAQNSIAQQQADDQLYLVHQYEGAVKSDQAQVENAQLNLAYCHIVSPVNGRVGLRLVDPGNYIQTGNATGLAVITQLKPISVIFVLPEDSLPAVWKRVSSGASLGATVFDRSGSTKIATGTLSTIDNQIDPTTGTFKLRAQFDNADEALFPNQFVNVQLLLDTAAGATIIPSAAVQRGAPGTFVYLVKPDSTVSVQKVTLGPSDSDRVVVTNGLQPGDNIVVDGADKLRDGAQVTVADQNAGHLPQAGGRASGALRRSRQ
jgi:membrane fusion protein, multidrug efflux system